MVTAVVVKSVKTKESTGLPNVSMPADADAADNSGTAEYRCVLTGALLFHSDSPHEIVEGGVRTPVAAARRAGWKHWRPATASRRRRRRRRVFPSDVIDVIARARLQPLELDRPAFIQRWQAYLLALQAAVERDHGVERTERLALGAQIFVKKLLREFDEFDFFTPRADSGDEAPAAAAPLAVLGYREDELTPYVYFLKEGVREVRGGANT